MLSVPRRILHDVRELRAVGLVPGPIDDLDRIPPDHSLDGAQNRGRVQIHVLELQHDGVLQRGQILHHHLMQQQPRVHGLLDIAFQVAAGVQRVL